LLSEADSDHLDEHSAEDESVKEEHGEDEIAIGSKVLIIVLLFFASNFVFFPYCKFVSKK